MLYNSPSGFDWYRPLIRFVKVPQSSVLLLGSMEDIGLSLAQKAADHAGRRLPQTHASVFLPVHELQIQNIVTKFPDVEVLHEDICIPGLAQCNLRFAPASVFNFLPKYDFIGRLLFPNFPEWL